MKKYLLLLSFVIASNLCLISQNYSNVLHLKNHEPHITDVLCSDKSHFLNNFFTESDNLNHLVLNAKDKLENKKQSYINFVVPFEKAFTILFKVEAKEMFYLALANNNLTDEALSALYNEAFEKTLAKLYDYKLINSLVERELFVRQQYDLNTGYLPKVSAACTNVNFADGTTNGWQCSWGTGVSNQINVQVGITGNCGLFQSYNATTDKCCNLLGTSCTAPSGYSPVMANVNNPAVTNAANSGVINTPANATTPGVHTIMTGGTDPNVPMPVVPPSGGNSIRLGNSNINLYKSQRIRQTFLVNAANPNFVYQYAVVLEDNGHTVSDQPFFNIRMYDQANNLINCATYDVNATSASTIPGFITKPSSIFKYKNWSSVTVPLLAYVGQNVTIEFTTSDCNQGGHFGYAYIQCQCSPIPILSSLPAVCNGQTTTLTAPAGAATYTWTGPGVVSGVNTQTAVVNLGGTYTVNMTTFYSPPQVPCQYSQTITLGGAPTAATPNFTALSVCLNSPSTFSNTTTGTSITKYTWNFGDGTPTFTSSVATNPVHTYTSPNTYSVTLTVDNGCPASITKQVIVNNQLTADFLVNSSCLSTVTNFTSTATPTIGIGSHAWDYGDGLTGSGANPSHTYANPGVYNITYTVTNGAACPGIITKSLTIFPKPVITFTTNPVCLNSLTNFTNTSSIATPGSISSWAWDLNNDGVTDNTTQSVSNTYTSAGVYNVELKAITNSGCKDSLTIPVTVNALPIAAFAPVNACLNANVLLNNTSTVTAPANIANYNWSFGSGSNLNNSSVSIPTSLSYSSSGIKTITLTIMANTSCSATVTKTVEIYPQPVANFSTTSVCQSTATTFSDLSSSLSSITSWAWDFTNNGSVDNSTNSPTNIYASSGSFSTSLIVTDINGCKDTVVLPVTVYGHAIPDFNSTSVCFGSISSFSNTTNVTANANVGDTPLWAWNFGDGSLSSSSLNPSHTYTSTVISAYNVTLTAITSNNCTDYIVKTITVSVLPTAAFTTTNVCLNSNLIFNNSSSVPLPDNIVSYSWNFGVGANIVNSNASNPTALTYTSGGIKTITLTVTANTTCSASVTNTVEIYQQPVANFSVTSVCESVSSSFTDLSTPTGSITNWAWDFTKNGTVDATSNTPFNTYSSSGTFTTSLIITDNHTCKDTINLPVNVWGHAIPDFISNGICYGTSSVFSNTTNITTNSNVGTIASYAWDFADGTPTSNLSDPTHMYLLGGNVNATYNVTLTATTSHNCVDDIVKVVNVYAIPTASFTSDQVCLQTASHLTDASNGSGNAVSNYIWDFLSDGTIDASGIANPTFIFPNYGYNQVSYTVSTSPVNGLICSNSTNSVMVWVNPNPNPNFTFVNNCINAQPINYNASSSNIAVGTNTAYTWAYGDGNTSVLNSSSVTTHTYLSAGVYNTTLTVFSDNGCQKSIAKQIEVYQKPNVSIVNSAACYQTAMTFTAVTLPASGTVSNWYWDFNNSISSIEGTGQISAFTFSAAGNQTVSLVSETNMGCRDSINKIIYVNYIPTPSFSVDVPSGCPEHCVTFTDLTLPVTGPAQITEWTWTLGDGSNTVTNSTNQSVNHCYQNNSSSQMATYDVKLFVKTDAGCSNSITKSAYINVFPTPVASYFVNPNPGSVLTPLEYYTNQSQDFTKWWWSFGDGSSVDSLNMNPTHYYDDESAKTYYSSLIVENQYGCRDVAYLPVEIAPDFTFYIPNAFSPANGDGVNDYFNGKGIGIAEFEMMVFDRWGEKVFHTNSIEEGWNGKVQGKSGDSKLDVYTWKVKLKDVLGKNHEYVGHVTVLR